MLVFDHNLRTQQSGVTSVRRKDKPAAASPGEQAPGGAPPPVDQADADSGFPEDQAGEQGAAAESGAPAGGSALAESLDAAVQRLEDQVAEWKDRALRAAADLDNYRRRAIRERDEASGRGQAEVLNRILEVVDDLARVAHLDPGQTKAEALHDGMLAIERKFQRALEGAGVERIDPAGAPFDPTAHEAVTMLPAPAAEADGTVGAVFQQGYRLRGTLLRPARVAVYKWTEPAPAADPVP